MLSLMRAAVLPAFGRPIVVRDVPEPTSSAGDVVVEVAATKVLAYAGDVFSGARGYLLTPPVVPGAGAIGRVVAVGPDAAQLAVGDWVFCDPTVRARDQALSPTTILQGLTAGDARGVRLQAWMHDGTWAERVRVPTENAAPIGPIDPADAPAWATLGNYLVPYGGFDAVRLQPGEVVVVNGATGAFGSAAVAVALALGAVRVVATGRSTGVLDRLAERFGPRVRTAPMRVDEESDLARIVEAAGAPIDVVLDILPPAASPVQVRAAMRSVRPGGRVVLMGGVREDLAVPYAWLMRYDVTLRGQWMYARSAIGRVVALVRAGLLALDGSKVTTFALDRVGEAIAHAAEHAAPFEATVLVP